MKSEDAKYIIARIFKRSPLQVVQIYRQFNAQSTIYVSYAKCEMNMEMTILTTSGEADAQLLGSYKHIRYYNNRKLGLRPAFI